MLDTRWQGLPAAPWTGPCSLAPVRHPQPWGAQRQRSRYPLRLKPSPWQGRAWPRRARTFLRATEGGGSSSPSLQLIVEDVLRGLLRVLLGVATAAVLLVFAGGQAFKGGHVEDSIRLFDAAAAVGYPKSLLWQRGISLYYAQRFQEGYEQFRKDAELNSQDTEESVWAMVCEAPLDGFEKSRSNMQVVQEESRPVMRLVYKLFRGQLGQEKEGRLRAALEQTAASSESAQDSFYANLYLGLLAEARGDVEESRTRIRQATFSDYGRHSPDYMADVARVHARLRGWEQPPP